MASTFTLFPLLPPEIQLQIWESALGTAGPRMIQLQPWTCERWRRWNKGCANKRHIHDDSSDHSSHRAAFVLWGYLETAFDGTTCGVSPTESVPTCDALAATCFDARQVVLQRFPEALAVFASASPGSQMFVRRELRFNPTTDILVFQGWRGFSAPAPAFDPHRDGAITAQHSVSDPSSQQFTESMKLVQNVAIQARRCDCGRRVRTSRFWRHMCGIEEQMGRLHFLDSLKRVYVFSGDSFELPEKTRDRRSPAEHGKLPKSQEWQELTSKQETAWEAAMRKQARRPRRVERGRVEQSASGIGDAVIMAGVVRRRFAESDLTWLRANGWTSRLRVAPDVSVWATGMEQVLPDEEAAGDEDGEDTFGDDVYVGDETDGVSDFESDIDHDDI